MLFKFFSNNIFSQIAIKYCFIWQDKSRRTLCFTSPVWCFGSTRSQVRILSPPTLKSQVILESCPGSLFYCLHSQMRKGLWGGSRIFKDSLKVAFEDTYFLLSLIININFFINYLFKSFKTFSNLFVKVSVLNNSPSLFNWDNLFLRPWISIGFFA